MDSVSRISKSYRPVFLAWVRQWSCSPSSSSSSISECDNYIFYVAFYCWASIEAAYFTGSLAVFAKEGGRVSGLRV